MKIEIDKLSSKKQKNAKKTIIFEAKFTPLKNVKNI
jgi:hypothetical protein